MISIVGMVITQKRYHIFMINCRGYYSKSHSEGEATIMNEAFIEMRLLFEKNI